MSKIISRVQKLVNKIFMKRLEKMGCTNIQKNCTNGVVSYSGDCDNVHFTVKMFDMISKKPIL